MAWYDDIGANLKSVVAGGISDAVDKWGGGAPSAVSSGQPLNITPTAPSYPEQIAPAPVGSGNAMAAPVVIGGVSFNPILLYGGAGLLGLAALLYFTRK